MTPDIGAAWAKSLTPLIIPRSPLLRRLVGPVLVLAAIGLIEGLSLWGVRIPAAGVVLLPLVVVATLLGGLGSGLLSALISCLFYAHFHNVPETLWLQQVSQRAWAASIATLAVVPVIEILRRQLVAEREWVEAALDWMLAAADDGFIVLDRHWRLTYLNQRAEQFWGRDRHSVQGRVLWESFPEMVGTDFEQKLRETSETREPACFQTIACVRGRWVEARVWPSTQGLSVHFQDVTDRKAAEAVQRLRLYVNEQLRVQENAEAMLAVAARALGEHLHVSRVVFIEVDFDSYEFVVQHEYRDVGVAPLQRRWRPERHPADPQTPVRLQQGQTLRIDDVDNAPDLEPVVYDILKKMNLGALITVPLIRDGAFSGSLSVHQLTPRHWTDAEVQLVEEIAGWTRQALERVRAEQALRHSEEWLRFALHATRVGTWDWRIATGEVNWSDNMALIHGLQPGAFDHRFESYFEHVYPDDRDPLRAAVQQAIDRDELLACEYRVLGSDGVIRWLEAKGRTLRDEDGQLIRLAGVCLEITERKKAELVLQNLNETLEGLVNERTAQLRSVARELSEAEQRERARLAGVLHDHLQQYLVAGRMRLNMLARQVPQELADAVRQTDELVIKAIEQSRSLAVDLSPPVLQHQGLIPALRWLIEQQKNYGLSVRFDVDNEIDEQAYSEIAKKFLFQAVRELLLNVAKHAAVEQASVAVAATPQQLQVTVEDAGRGCDPHAVLEAELSEGTGFGLASIKHRLELLGGQFEMTSMPWQGCRTVLTVPADAGKVASHSVPDSG